LPKMLKAILFVVLGALDCKMCFVKEPKCCPKEG